MTGRRPFGSVRKHGRRWQVRYRGPDGKPYTARTDDGRPLTFDTEGYADAWLARTYADIQRGTWKPAATEIGSAPAPISLRAYSTTWLDGRDLSPSTCRVYRQTLNKQILPALGDSPVTAITPVMVRNWHAKLPAKTPRQRATAYALLRTILNTAVADDLIGSNPCRVRGAGSASRARQIQPASVAELEQIAKAMPAGYQLAVLLAAWCALRFGELAELRRSDVDVKAGVVRVRRGVVRGGSGLVVKDPKSQAGKRDVNIPPHLMPAVRDHLAAMPAGPNALLFPGDRGGNLSPSTLYGMYYPAREAAGRPDLRFHDLRHTGAVLAAATGATLAELMARLGHSTVSAAMRYQHAAADRDKAIAEALSELATVTPITAAKGTRKRREADGR